MERKKIKAVFFDVEGTFLHISPSVGEVYARFWKEKGYEVSPSEIMQRFIPAFRDKFKHDKVERWTQEICKKSWYQIFEKTFEPLKNAPCFEEVFQKSWEFFATKDCVILAQDFPEILSLLKKQGIKTAVISNWDARLRNILKQLGLGELFDEIFIGCEVGYLKPDLKLFQTALEVLKVDPHKALMIGDSLKNDIEPAKTIGMLTYHYQGEPFSEVYRKIFYDLNFDI